MISQLEVERAERQAKKVTFFKAASSGKPRGVSSHLNPPVPSHVGRLGTNFSAYLNRALAPYVAICILYTAAQGKYSHK